MEGEINITAGQNVILPCRAPNQNIIVLEWSRADLESGYILMYRDEQLNPENQHPSFKDRVDLQDRQMKDGDVSVILRNVTTADSGTYECRVFRRGTNRWNRALLKTAPISIITLRVVPPPGPGGTREDGGKEDARKEDGGKEDARKEDGVIRGRPGLTASLSVCGVICVVVVAFVIFRTLKKYFR